MKEKSFYFLLLFFLGIFFWGTPRLIESTAVAAAEPETIGTKWICLPPAENTAQNKLISNEELFLQKEQASYLTMQAAIKKQLQPVRADANGNPLFAKTPYFKTVYYAFNQGEKAG